MLTIGNKKNAPKMHDAIVIHAIVIWREVYSMTRGRWQRVTI